MENLAQRYRAVSDAESLVETLKCQLLEARILLDDARAAVNDLEREVPEVPVMIETPAWRLQVTSLMSRIQERTKAFYARPKIERKRTWRRIVADALRDGAAAIDGRGWME